MFSDIYQHYRKEEEPFIDQVYDWLSRVDNTYTPFVSQFLTPREATIVKQIQASYSDNMAVSFFGGYDGAERTKAIIYPLYYEPTIEDYDIVALNVRFPEKFAQITHGRILGTLMSTGVTRDRIGDIITDDNSWHIILDKSIKDYIQLQVTKIANVGVTLEDLELSELLTPSETWRTETIITSSLRIDTLLANVYNFSRQRAKDSIYQTDVKLNFVPIDRPDQEVGVNDIVSLRKHGRFWIQSVEGKTRKDNYRLIVNVLEV